MCPDKELLSSFVDGEVPSPWKERIELHVTGCPSCASTVEAFRGITESLHAAESVEETDALNQAAARIGASLDFRAPLIQRQRGFAESFSRVWSCRVSLPMPFLAAGAVALLLAGLFLGVFRPVSDKGAMASTSLTRQLRQVSLESIAQNVKQSSLQPVMIDVPAESVFSQYGNPVIMSFEAPSIQEVSGTSTGDK
jgi:anti-sigma factor RsiW